MYARSCMHAMLFSFRRHRCCRKGKREILWKSRHFHIKEAAPRRAYSIFSSGHNHSLHANAYVHYTQQSHTVAVLLIFLGGWEYISARSIAILDFVALYANGCLSIEGKCQSNTNNDNNNDIHISMYRRLCVFAWAHFGHFENGYVHVVVCLRHAGRMYPYFSHPWKSACDLLRHF